MQEPEAKRPKIRSTTDSGINLDDIADLAPPASTSQISITTGGIDLNDIASPEKVSTSVTKSEIDLDDIADLPSQPAPAAETQTPQASDHRGEMAKQGNLEQVKDSDEEKAVEKEQEDEKEDDLFDLLDGVPLEGDDLEFEEQVEDPPEEIARRHFAEDLAARPVSPERLPSLIGTLEGEAPQWGPVRRWRSAALLCAYVARSTRETRTAFVSGGMPLLGSLLGASIEALEGIDVIQRQSAADWAIACLACLRMLPIGRATMWEHRHSVGKTFDRLHRWCGMQKSHTAAEIRAPMEALCRRWRRQPKPAAQDKEGGAQRQRVVLMVTQALSGVVHDESLLPPFSPTPQGVASSMQSSAPLTPLSSPAAHFLPFKTAAAEIEVELYKRSGGLTAEYKHSARMLRTNLANPANSVLRERVLSGELSPAELVSLRSEDLAPEELQQQRKEIMKEGMAKVVDKDGLGDLPKSPLKSKDGTPIIGPDGVQVERSGSGDLSMVPPPSVLIHATEAGKDEVALPSAGPMAPPPTPFRMPEETPSSAATKTPSETVVPPNTPDVMATPAVEDDDEVTALIQRLSGRP